MPLPILLPILGALLGGGSLAGGMMSRKSEATGEDAGLLGRLFPDQGVQARQEERRQAGIMEQNKLNDFMAEKGLMGQGWAQGRGYNDVRQQQGAYEAALARNQAIAAQSMGLMDRDLTNAGKQQQIAIRDQQELDRQTKFRMDIEDRARAQQEQSMAALQPPKPPSGYQWNQSGTGLEPIPGTKEAETRRLSAGKTEQTLNNVKRLKASIAQSGTELYGETGGYSESYLWQHPGRPKRPVRTGCSASGRH